MPNRIIYKGVNWYCPSNIAIIDDLGCPSEGQFEGQVEIMNRK